MCRSFFLFLCYLRYNLFYIIVFKYQGHFCLTSTLHKSAGKLKSECTKLALFCKKNKVHNRLHRGMPLNRILRHSVQSRILYPILITSVSAKLCVLFSLHPYVTRVHAHLLLPEQMLLCGGRIQIRDFPITFAKPQHQGGGWFRGANGLLSVIEYPNNIF